MENSTIYNDKIGRKISIVKEDDEFRALYENKQIGHVSFEVQRFDDGKCEMLEYAHPKNIHVKEGYRRAGIASEMIKFAAQFYKSISFVSDSGMGAKSGGIYYDTDGLALKYACEKAGITQCIDEEEW